MLTFLKNLYFAAVLHRPWMVLIPVLLLLAAASTQIRHFQLDASAESLVLEGSEEMSYYREIRARYGSDDFLIVTYTPEAELFSDASLHRMLDLRNELEALPRVHSVISILDVPLLDSPRVTFTQVQEGTRTLLDPDVDRDLAREEFRTSPLYRDLLMNRDADTAALLVQLTHDAQAAGLLQRRDELRRLRDTEGLDPAQAAELREVTELYAQRNAEIQQQLAVDIAEVRSILDRYRGDALIYLGGVPMIIVDMIDFVRGDLRTFGVGVALFIVGLLALAFRRLRWVAAPGAICAGVAVGMLGFLGWVSWPVTVVSSNFVSLVLILTLSLIVHLVVRHRELHNLEPQASMSQLLRETVRSKIKPSFYTALTTMVAFGAMVFSNIRPVMDFGLMMVCAVAAGFVLTFLLLPALLAPFAPGPIPTPRRDVTARFTEGTARLAQRRALPLWLVFAALSAAGIAGTAQITVENRFIDYFKSSTEIYQGMELIDRELGGTTPLDVVLDPTAEYLAFEEREPDEEDLYDPFDDPLDYAYEDGAEEGPLGGYWFTSFQLEVLEDVRAYLEDLPETGKILSVPTSMQLMTHLNEGRPLNTFELAVVYNRLPPELREILFEPYLSEDGNQVRFDIRVIDSDPNLERDALLRQIEEDLLTRFDLAPEQVNLSGMLVLYNDVLQTLWHSQFVTLAVVFAVMMLMFGFLYRSARMALIGPLPTLVAAISVLGLMGWIGLPLDIMTMTIAAITIGIGVHDTIHYADRFQQDRSGSRLRNRDLALSHQRRARHVLHHRDRGCRLFHPRAVELHADRILRPAHRRGDDLRVAQQSHAAAAAAAAPRAVRAYGRCAAIRILTPAVIPGERASDPPAARGERIPRCGSAPPACPGLQSGRG